MDEFELMRVKKAELLEYRLNRLKANNLANVILFFIMLFIGACIYLKMVL